RGAGDHGLSGGTPKPQFDTAAWNGSGARRRRDDRLDRVSRRRLAFMTEHYDLVVIGAGPAGEKGAAQAAYFGKRVCIVERAPKPGGAMVNSGTVPSKTLRETAMYFSGFRQRGVYGVDLRVKPGITVGDFMQRERNVIETEWELIDENIQRHHITTIQGTARFVDARTLEVTRYGTTTRRL